MRRKMMCSKMSSGVRAVAGVWGAAVRARAKAWPAHATAALLACTQEMHTEEIPSKYWESASFDTLCALLAQSMAVYPDMDVIASRIAEFSHPLHATPPSLLKAISNSKSLGVQGLRKRMAMGVEDCGWSVTGRASVAQLLASNGTEELFMYLGLFAMVCTSSLYHDAAIRIPR
jgi:hypothetical protein